MCTDYNDSDGSLNSTPPAAATSDERGMGLGGWDRAGSVGWDDTAQRGKVRRARRVASQRGDKYIS